MRRHHSPVPSGANTFINRLFVRFLHGSGAISSTSCIIFLHLGLLSHAELSRVNQARGCPGTAGPPNGMCLYPPPRHDTNSLTAPQRCWSSLVITYSTNHFAAIYLNPCEGQTPLVVPSRSGHVLTTKECLRYTQRSGRPGHCLNTVHHKSSK